MYTSIHGSATQPPTITGNTNKVLPLVLRVPIGSMSGTHLHLAMLSATSSSLLPLDRVMETFKVRPLMRHKYAFNEQHMPSS